MPTPWLATSTMAGRRCHAPFTPGAQGFRVMVEGKTADGTPFQRVHAPLFTVTR